MNGYDTASMIARRISPFRHARSVTWTNHEAWILITTASPQPFFLTGLCWYSTETGEVLRVREHPFAFLGRLFPSPDGGVVIFEAPTLGDETRGTENGLFCMRAPK